jgi:WD40 repeat protein
VTEDDFPEVKVDFQETFLGHNSSISCCRFSASGSNVASSSVDGTVRIWTYDSSTPSSKNATIYCGSEVSALSWECRSDRLAQLMVALKLGMLMQRELFATSVHQKTFPGYNCYFLAYHLSLC